MYIPVITELFQSLFMYDSETWEEMQQQKYWDELKELESEELEE
jgi:hypothetical protein